MPEAREKFATQVDSAVLSKVQELAKEEGRQIQALVEEAMMDLLEKHSKSRPRSHVMVTYQKSHGRYADLYDKLAK